MYYVYTIQSQRNRKIYVGYTNDLRKRLKMHNSAEVFSTKPYRPFKLIYYEAYQNKNDALERERFLKSGWGKNYLKKVLKHYFSTLPIFEKT
jgi:putative endonuclease